MGAPLVTKERLPDPDHICRPVRLMAKHTGARFTAVMAGEVGAENGILPFLVAALLDLPVVDVDTMGRAFPEMQMSSFVIRGLPLAPFALSDIRGNDVLLTAAAAPSLSNVSGARSARRWEPWPPPADHRGVAATQGPWRASQRQSGYPLRRCRPLRPQPSPRSRRDDSGGEHGVLLFCGKVIDVARRTTAGFVRGTATFDGARRLCRARFEVEFQNEFTIGRLDGELTITVPDLLCIVDVVTGEAIGTETIRYGQRVAIMSLPADPDSGQRAKVSIMSGRAPSATPSISSRCTERRMTSPHTNFTPDDLKSLALGVGILGTGGGTHPYLELLNIEKLYQQGYTAIAAVARSTRAR